MSRMHEHHKPKCGVDGKCSVPMFSGYGPAGFCDKDAFGEQYEPGSKYAPGHWSPRDRNGCWINPNNLPPYAPGLCCKSHGGPDANGIRFIMDGNMWCAFMPGFVNLQESAAGFGPTQAAAECNFQDQAA